MSDTNKKLGDVLGDVPSVVGSVSKAVFRGLLLMPAFVLLFAAIGYLASTNAKDVYEARAEVIVLSKRLEDNRVSLGGTLSRSVILPPATQDLISETHILESITLIEQSYIDAAPNNGLFQLEGSEFNGKIDIDALAEAVLELSEDFEVIIEPGSNIISLNLRHENQNFAIDYLSAHLDNYFSYREDLTKDNTQISFLVERVEELEKELTEVTQLRQDILAQSSAIDPESETELNWENIRDEHGRLSRLELRLSELESDYRLQQAALITWNASGPDELPLGGASPSVPLDTYEYLVRLHGTLTDVSARYIETRPQVTVAREQFINAKAGLINSLQQELNATGANIDALVNEIHIKRGAISALRNKNGQLSKIQSDLAALDAKLDTTQESYTMALSSLEDARAASITSTGLSNIRVLQQPSLTSLEPISTNRLVYVLSGAALGFLLCILLSVVLFTRPSQK